MWDNNVSIVDPQHPRVLHLRSQPAGDGLGEYTEADPMDTEGQGYYAILSK